MKLVKYQKRANKIGIITPYITQIEQYVVFAYLLCMLGIFPLYYKEQYYGIGNAKYEFFWNASLSFIGITLIFTLIKLILERILQGRSNKTIATYKKQAKEENIFLKVLDNLSFLDYAVFIYGICVVLSYAFSDFKDFAFRGAAGWEMGLCSQMIFVTTYFILSRQNIFKGFFYSKQKIYATYNQSKQRKFASIILAVHLISSALTFLFGILHRFEIDPLGMYVGLDLYQKIEFLSTIGQATWFSGYVCTVFAVGVILFYVSEKHWPRIITGIYSVLSFGILVTQNSDSAFIAIAGIMLLMGYFSLLDMKKWCRFCQVSSLMWGTFAGIGILQKVFVNRAIPLDTLSNFFSQSIFTWLMLLVNVGIIIFYAKLGRKKDAQIEKVTRITKAVYQVILVLVVIFFVALIFFIYLNTKGYLLQWFDYQITHPYLLFDYHWGSNRGSTWMISWQTFMQLPFYQKLFGVGPDSLSAYLYSVPEISDLLHSLWGNVRLTNAHNEYLNSLICYGVVGVSAWLAVLIGGITYFYKKAEDNPFMIAFAFCIMGYACHNIFCYQQVCATPFLFIALGIGESLTKSENFNTIK